jgi:hypothetical protein
MIQSRPTSLPCRAAERTSATASDLQLFLFSTDTDMIRSSVAGGVAGIVVDWERIGKWNRQSSADTQISHDTFEDLVRVREATSLPVICRIDNHAPAFGEQVRTALSGGANEILLPMVRSVNEVETILDLVAGRAGVGILIETTEAVTLVESLARLRLSRVYLGLNDLAITRGAASIFSAVLDGTVEHVRRQVGVPFGFGGLTLPDRGAPIPCRLLLGEMARLRCDFSFLRRSFHRDTRAIGPAEAIPEIARAFRQACRRSADEVRRQRAMFETAVLATVPGEPPGTDAASERTA